MSGVVFRFKGRATGSDPTGYYHPRWDLAQHVSVLEATQDEVDTKARAMLGTHHRFGSEYRGISGWGIILDSADEVVTSDDRA